jgi:hypothetical protein
MFCLHVCSGKSWINVYTGQELKVMHMTNITLVDLRFSVVKM